jgi:voltage-gated potassium channel
VIDIYKISANRIHNILNKPVATKLLDSFLSHEGHISYKEIHIPIGSSIDGVKIDDIDFSSYGILLVGIIDVELSHKFIFVTTSEINHKIDAGDVIVCIGHNDDLDKFEQRIASQSETKIGYHNE